MRTVILVPEGRLRKPFAHYNVIMGEFTSRVKCECLVMAGRKKRLPEDATPTTVWFTPAERVVLTVIEARRSARRETRDSPSEIIWDALWRFLTEVEGIERGKIEELLPPKPAQQPSKVKGFPGPAKPSR